MNTNFSNASSGGLAPKSRFSRFLFANELPYGLAIVRILMPLVLLLVVLPRWRHTREIYSDDGAPAPLAINYGFVDFLPEFSGGLAVALMSALVFFLVASSIGWYTRVSLVASMVLYTYFNLMDCLSTLTKYSVIASHILFILCLSNCGAIWSLDSWLKRGRRMVDRGKTDFSATTGPAWPRRLMQILVGVVYFGSAMTKLHTPTYFSGDQLRYWMMSDVNHANPLGEYLSLFPVALIVFAYVAVIWEMLFLFLAWKGFGRVVMLTLGVGFHLMTCFTLGLYIFPLVCVTMYFAFINEHDSRTVVRMWYWLRVKWSWIGNFSLLRLSIPIPGAGSYSPTHLRLCYGLAIGLVVVLGVEGEYWLDPYGIRRSEGPHSLVELDSSYVRKYFNVERRIRQQDKFEAFDVGTGMVSGNLMQRRTDFQHGESLIAQCTLNPPHEDMWVECNLHDAQDRVLDRVGQMVPRETMRCSFIFYMTESLEPGKYFLVVKSAGQAITRKAITLRPRLQSPVAH